MRFFLLLLRRLAHGGLPTGFGTLSVSFPKGNFDWAKMRDRLFGPVDVASGFAVVFLGNRGGVLSLNRAAMGPQLDIR
jgi:hypothetical protein